MGKEANFIKDRKCNYCNKILKTTAKEIKKHVELCKNSFKGN